LGTDICLSIGDSTDYCSSGAPPEETLDDRLTAVLPTFEWVQPTSTGNGTEAHALTDSLNTNIGSATATFPMCLTYNWLTFVDQFKSMTDGTVSPQQFRMTSNLGTPSSLTIDASRGTVATGTSFLGIVNMLSLFVAAVGWTLFGIMVFRDIFVKQEGETTT
jgi:hypothetical protein